MNRCTAIALAALLGLAACRKEPAPTFQELFFEVPLTMRPARPTMAVGDTLWLEADYSDSLRDIRSGKRFRWRPEDGKPHVFISFMELTGQPERQRNFAKAFQVINQVGRIANLQQTAGSFEPVYQDGRYRIKIGLVAVKTGIASITVNLNSDPSNPLGLQSELSFLEMGEDTNGRKIRPILGDIYYVMNEGNTNFALFQQYSQPVSTSLGAPEGNVYYEQKSTFNVMIQ